MQKISFNMKFLDVVSETDSTEVSEPTTAWVSHTAEN